MKKKNKSKKKKIIIIAVIVVAVLVIIVRNNSKEIVEEKVETEAIERRNISQSISATGTIKAENSQEITSSLTGMEIASVNVAEGQTVAAGDIICSFNLQSVQNTLSNAEASANIAGAQSDLGIQSAQRNLSDAISSRDRQVVDAQREVANAQQAYDAAQSKVNEVSAQIAAKQAEIANWQAEMERTEDGQIERFQIQPLNEEIAALQASLPELQAQVTSLKAAYDAAVSALQTTTATADSNVATMRENLSNAELSAKSAEIAQDGQLQPYEEQLQKGIVTAPAAGTITAVNVKVGDLYAGGTIATVKGADDFVIEAEIDEYDIADVAVGMKVLVKTDATREEELEGSITYVAATATEAASSSPANAATSTGSATYKVKITLGVPNDRLRVGMNAKLSIIAQERQNVWAVPYTAVQEREDGTKYIEILKNEETEEKEQVDVTTGLESSYYVEIQSSQLQEGQLVVIPNSEGSDSVDALLEMMGADGGI